MKFNKLALGVALSMIVVAPTFAEDPVEPTNPTNPTTQAESSQGTIRFTGFINDVPCSIDNDNLNQTVKFGEIALHELTTNNFRSDSENFDIVLKNCSTETYKTAKVAFTGSTVSGFEGYTGELLGLGSKVENAGIVITDRGNNPITFGKAFPTDGKALNNGDGAKTTLQFSAYVKGNEADSKKATTGSFDTVANFKVVYQ
ncbi:fimbrial protein [Proteus mirabilis]|uniref:fimbrial protein n=1 Tax=Proteus mirabilis TaxID=584 RepID=UPI003D28B475